MKQVIVADKNSDNRTLLEKFLEENGVEVKPIETSFALKQIEQSDEEFFGAIIDYNFLAENDTEFLQHFKKTHPNTIYIVLTSSKEIVSFFQNTYPDIKIFLKPTYPEEILKVLNRG